VTAALSSPGVQRQYGPAGPHPGAAVAETYDTGKKFFSGLWESLSAVPGEMVGGAKKKLTESMTEGMFGEAGSTIASELPDLGKGSKSSLKYQASAAVTLPLAEFGVPASVKLGKGSTIEISREGTAGAAGGTPKGTKFVVTVEGEAQLYIVETLTEQKLEVGVSLPSGGKAKAGGGGGGGAETVGAKGPTVSGEGGLKGTLTQKYEFVAGEPGTKGIGGMAAFLSVMGLSETMGETGGGLLRSVAGYAFMDQLTEMSMKMAAGGEATVDLLKVGDVETLKAKVAGSLSQTLSQKKKEGGGTELTQTIAAELEGEAAAELAIPLVKNALGIGGMRAAFGHKGSVSLELVWNDAAKAFLAEALSLEYEMKLSASGFDPGMLAALLPGGRLPDEVSKALEPYRKGLRNGVLSAKWNGKASNIAEVAMGMYTRLAALFAKDDWKAEDAFKIVVEELTNLKLEAGFELKLTTTSRLGVDVSAGLGEATQKIGVDVSVGGEYGEERLLYEKKTPAPK